MNKLTRRATPTRRHILAGISAIATMPMFGGVARAAPQKGGFFRIGLADGSQTDTLDPATWPSAFTGACLGGSLCNNLTELLPDGSLAPDLAESWESQDKSKRWIINVRKGVTFHNGRTLMAKDVVASLQHHVKHDTKSPAKAILGGMESIKALDDYTVEILLDGSKPDLAYMLTDYHLPIMQAADDGSLDFSAPIGTGPFSMQSWVPGSPARMVRHPNYHKDNKPYFDEVEFVPIVDVVARTNALLTGEVDFINSCDINTLSRLEAQSNIEVMRTPSLRHSTFDMNTQEAPFDNAHVRRALKYAINRQEILEKVFFNNATIGNDNNVASHMKFWAETPPQHSYDIDEAKRLLALGGVSSVEFDLHVSNVAFPGAIQAALLFKEQAAPAGININVIRQPDDGYWSNVWRTEHFVGADWYGRATVDWLFTTTLAKDAPWNDTKFANERFNELLVKGREETDDAIRSEIYAEMQQILHDDGGMIVVAFMSYIDAISNKIGRERVGGTYPLDNFKMTERWWRA